MTSMFSSVGKLLYTPSAKQTNRSQRQRIAQDTIARSEAITAQHANEGASTDSTFVKVQLPALDVAARPNPHRPPTKIKVINSDSFAAARDIIKHDSNARGKTAVLNLASDEHPGGGWTSTLCMTQEEALCYSSTLYATLKETYYPWPNLGPGSTAGVFSPGVVIFKDDLDHQCHDLRPEDRRVVSVITVAAPRLPKLTEDQLSFKNPSDLEDLRQKIRLVYRMAAHNGQQYMVLAAMGCGAYECPPGLVAGEMKSILLEPEFQGWFHQVVFAVYSRQHNGSGNFEIFEETFKGVEL